MSDRVLSVASLIKIALLLACAGLIVTGAAGCVEPAPLEEEVAADVAEIGACAPVRVDAWVRFFRDGEELSCAQVVAEGYELEASVLGGAGLATVRGWCSAQVQPNPARRIGTGVWSITNGVGGANLAVRVTGSSVEHSIPITACGRTGSVMLTIEVN